MHWRYEDVLNLPTDVYAILVTMLKTEHADPDAPDDDTDED